MIERQITPLMLRMIDGLEQFVMLDLPFLSEERATGSPTCGDDGPGGCGGQREAQPDPAGVSDRKRVRTDHGSLLRTPSTLAVRTARSTFSRVGRVSLVYPDTRRRRDRDVQYRAAASGKIDDSFKTSVQNGIRMARKQLSVDMLPCPIAGPEAAQ